MQPSHPILAFVKGLKEWNNTQIMKRINIRHLLVGLSLLMCGCTTHREFRGTISNLGGQEKITTGEQSLDMKVNGAGITCNGKDYIVFHLAGLNSQLVLFFDPPPQAKHEKLQANHGEMTLMTNSTESSSAEAGLAGAIVTPETNVAWLASLKSLDQSRLKFGSSETNLPASALKLHGLISANFDGDNNVVDLSLSDDLGKTKIAGSFETYRAVWGPLIGPMILIFGEEGPRANAVVFPIKPSINVKVTGRVKHPGLQTLPKSSKLDMALKSAGGLAEYGHDRRIRIHRMIAGRKCALSITLTDLYGTMPEFCLADGDELFVSERLR
jgi:SLBB domain